MRSELIGQAGRRFQSVAWVAVGLLLASGVANLLARPQYLQAPTFQAKLALVVLALILSILHDFVLGPRVNRLPPEAATARKWVNVLARVNMLVALAIVLLGLALDG